MARSDDDLAIAVMGDRFILFKRSCVGTGYPSRRLSQLARPIYDPLFDLSVPPQITFELLFFTITKWQNYIGNRTVGKIFATQLDYLRVILCCIPRQGKNGQRSIRTMHHLGVVWIERQSEVLLRGIKPQMKFTVFTCY